MTPTARSLERIAFAGGPASDTGPDRAVPHWRRIELALRARLGELTPGDPLPSDADLCREFGVSRMTARNAMARLADDGLIVRISGRGSYVAEPPAHRRADRLLTFSHEMRRQGRVPSSRLLAREIRPSTLAEAASLGIRASEPVVLVRRLRCADDEPITLETAVLIQPVAAAVMAADVEHGSLHEALAGTGWHLRRGTATISAAAATAEDARLLGLRRGDPLLVERRVIADGHGRRVEATESRYPADRYALDVQFDVEPDTDQETR
jgi:GntR family transcriptional regulator